MNVVIASDLHVAEHEDFSYVLPDGSSSRLADCLRVIDQIALVVEKYNCPVVIFGGDLFHTPRAVSTAVFQPTYQRLEKLAQTKKVKRIIFNAGNHDLANYVNPQTSIYALRRLPNTEIVYDGPGEVSLDGTVRARFLPYTRDKDQLLGWLNSMREERDGTRRVLFTHCEVAEATNGPNEVRLRTRVGVEDLRATGADFVFCGHHHHPQRLADNVAVIGATLQHNQLDRGDARGLIIYDTERNSIKRLRLGGPQFYLFDVSSKGDLDQFSGLVAGGYVRVMLHTKSVSEQEVIEVLKSVKARKWDVRPAFERQVVLRDQAITSKLLGASGNVCSVLEEFVEGSSQHPLLPQLDKETLVRVGRRLLNGAG